MLLLTNNVAGLAALILAAVMVAATHTHYKVKDPIGKVMFPAILGLACLYVAFCQREAKKEKTE